MRIARLIAVLEPGGAQLTALRLTLGLGRRGAETRMLAGHATSAGRDLFVTRRIPLDVWGEDDSLQYSCRPELAAWLRPRLQGADVVHAHMFGGWWAAARAVEDGTPLVASEHNELRWPGEPRLDEMREALQRVDLFFAHGPAAREQVIASGLPADRVRPGVAPIVGFDSVPAPDLPTPRIVFAGRLHHEKGADLLVEAVSGLADPPATFILGDGPMEAELRREVRRHGLERVVRVVGWVPDPGSWIAGAAACVVPSRHEAWSQTAVLAMGLGVPVIGAAVEGLPLTLGDERGLLFAPGDAVALGEVIEDVLAGRRRPEVDRARRYALDFTPDRVSSLYMEEYSRLLLEGSRARAPTAPRGGGERARLGS
jgi:glycosyltransferase involved in cell wall biosynthesis